MLKELLKERALPPLCSREEMLEILLREEYGYLPPKPDRLSWTEEVFIKNFSAGKAVVYKVTLKAEFGEKEFSFPIYATLPTKPGKYPFFIHINFRPEVPDRYMPSEELVDNGYAVLSFSYLDVTSDDGDFTNGLAGVLFENGQRKPTDPGKIAMWAWATHRVLDYAESVDCLDPSKAIVCGHSRLGKTALVAAATDERFYCTHSNDSGCSGAAISRGKVGESVAAITKKFPYWFCENFYQYADREGEMPFDQHFLIASVAPRLVHVASAKEDTWADPDSEFLACVAAGDDFICADRLPVPGDAFHEGRIGYALREGTHYFGRKDWQNLIDFLNNKTLG